MPNRFDDLPDMLTVQQTAGILNVCRNTVYAWCNSGKLPSFKVGNTRRIRKEALQNLIAEMEAA